MKPILETRRDQLQKQMDDEWPAMTVAEAYELDMLNSIMSKWDDNADLLNLAIAATSITNHALLTRHQGPERGNKVKLSIIMMSHLSDMKIQHDRQVMDTHCEFLKWLILKFPHTNTEIDPEEQYQLFLNRHDNPITKTGDHS